MFHFGRPDKSRPVVVLSRQAAIDHLHTVVVAPITSAIRGLPSEVKVGPGDGLKTDSVVNCDHIYTVPQSGLRRWLGRLDGRRMAGVCEAVNVALGCA
ncbi:MAG: type II toxin-antitoxin system PemK/MazF family toxin [Deltaproteobacteria bacterium]|nr:type II toxin-antitoxin system PemK/MazF family toxin [Deltaproteobacteria bacterium]